LWSCHSLLFGTGEVRSGATHHQQRVVATSNAVNPLLQCGLHPPAAEVMSVLSTESKAAFTSMYATFRGLLKVWWSSVEKQVWRRKDRRRIWGHYCAGRVVKSGKYPCGVCSKGIG